MKALWRLVLALVPTSALQAALSGREGVETWFVGPDQDAELRIPGAAVVTVNRD